jgi:hypothetical protein
MKLYKENGCLSEVGELTLKKYFDGGLRLILNAAESEAEVKLLGSLIQKRVGDLVFDYSLKLKR